jgi:hypothetical protein
MTRKLWMGVLFLWAGTATAQGAMITFDFTGRVTSVTDPSGILTGKIGADDLLTGSVTFDSETPNWLPEDGTLGIYRSPNASLSVSIGNVGLLQTGEAVYIDVANESYGDGYSIGAAAPVYSGDLRFSEFEAVHIEDPTGTALSTDALPLTPPPLSAFQWRGFGSFVYGPNGELASFAGEILTLTPEPATLALVGLALVTLPRRRGRGR